MEYLPMRERIHEKHYDTHIEGLYTADCVDFMASMPLECVDLLVTSPPYNNLRNYKGYSFAFEQTAESLFTVIKKGEVLVWVVGDKINGGRSLTSFRQGIYFQEIGFNMHDVMICQKKNTPFMCPNAYAKPRIKKSKE